MGIYEIHLFQHLFVCLLLNDKSALFRLLVPSIVDIEHMRRIMFY